LTWHNEGQPPLTPTVLTQFIRTIIMRYTRACSCHCFTTTHLRLSVGNHSLQQAIWPLSVPAGAKGAEMLEMCQSKKEVRELFWSMTFFVVVFMVTSIILINLNELNRAVHAWCFASVFFLISITPIVVNRRNMILQAISCLRRLIVLTLSLTDMVLGFCFFWILSEEGTDTIIDLSLAVCVLLLILSIFF